MSRAMKVLLCALATVFVAAGANNSQLAPTRETVGIDHVILGVSNLDHGTSQFEQLTGVRPAPGGAHPGRGTRNALISLGPRTYLEILAPSPGDTLSDDVSFLPSLDKLTPVGWAVSTSDIGRTAQRLRDSGYETSGPKTGSRIRADGTRLKWDTLHILKPSMNMAPFFIQWGKGSLHPATSSPGGCTLLTLEVTESTVEPLHKLVQVLGLDVVVKSGPEPVMKVTLGCPGGRVVLGR